MQMRARGVLTGQDATDTVSYFVGIALMAIYYLGTWMLLNRRSRSNFIRKRNPMLLLVQAVTALGTSCLYWANAGGGLTWYYERDVRTFYYAEVSVHYLCGPLYQLTFYARAVMLLNDYYVNYALMRQLRAKYDQQLVIKPSPLEQLIFRSFPRHKRLRCASIRQANSSARRLSRAEFAGIALDSHTVGSMVMLSILTWAMLLVVALMASGTLMSFSIEATDSPYRWIPMYLFALLFLLLMPVLLWEARKVDDPYLLRRELCVAMAILYICLVPYFITMFDDDIRIALNVTDPDVFLLTSTLACHTVFVAVPAVYCRMYERRNLERLKGLTIEQFATMIQQPTIWAEFKNSLAKDYSLESGYFIEQMVLLRSSPCRRSNLVLSQESGRASISVALDVSKMFNYDSQLLSSDLLEEIPRNDKEMTAKIRDIYGQFIAPGSPNELNLTYNMRMAIKKDIDSGNATVLALEPALVEVIILLYRNNYGRFLEYIAQNGTAGRTVPFGHDGIRLRRFLADALGVPLALQHRLLREGKLYVNGERVRAGGRSGAEAALKRQLLAGDTVATPHGTVTGVEKKEAAPTTTTTTGREELEVLYRDADVVVVNKPAGMAVHGGSKQTSATTVAGLLSTLKFDYDDPPRLVHRLDRDTSGVLVLARTRSAAVWMTRAFHPDTPSEDRVEKEYLAVLSRWAAESADYRCIDAAMAVHTDRHTGNQRMCVSEEAGQAARTWYRVLCSSRTHDRALVSLRPETGRKHQLRVHMARYLSPIVGDTKRRYQRTFATRYGETNSKMCYYP
ncbi:hypothetical protein RI367_005178 [Sorochytrium milnesiophthora]